MAYLAELAPMSTSAYSEGTRTHLEYEPCSVHPIQLYIRSNTDAKTKEAE